METVRKRQRKPGSGDDNRFQNGSSQNRMVLSIDMLRDPSIQSKNYSRTKDLAWKLTTGLMAAFFYTAAVLQINDPDSEIWIIMYLIPGFICCAIILFPNIQDHWLFKSITLFQLAVSLAGVMYTIYTGSHEIAKHRQNIFESEEGREIGGLVIVMAWLCMMLNISSKSIQTMKSSSWFKVIAVAIIPVILTAIWWSTVDIAQSPAHCKGILNKVS